MYLLGRTNVDVTEDATVTVPLVMSTTSIGECVGGGSTVTLSPSQAFKSDAGSCGAAGPSAAAPTTTTAVSVANASASDNTGNSASCSSAGAQFLLVDYYFGANGLQPGQTLTLTWRGRAGSLNGAYSYGTALTTAGGTGRINTGGASWTILPAITTSDTSASTYQTFTDSVTLTAAMITGACPSCSLIIRIAGSSAASTHNSVVDTDFIQVTVQ
jgi:hypothetical protein